MTANGLIDTTEMYLRTIFELEEEGITPLRARIAERLGQSGPTVSQTVNRMERDGLLHIEGDRHLELTEEGRRLATRVMRKHRLAECLLVDVIGLAWEDVHVEACRWEHVMSEAVERQLVALLEAPAACPHGNPIPELEELGAENDEGSTAALPVVSDMSDAATPGGARAVVHRISEQIQGDTDLMHKFREGGIQPGREVTLARSDDGVRVTSGEGPSGGSVDLPRRIALHVFVAQS